MARKIIHGARAAGLIVMSILMVQGLTSPAANAQERMEGAAPDQMAPPSEDVQRIEAKGADVLLRGTTLLGMELRNDAGEKLGTIKDAAIDGGLDQVSYVAVERGDDYVAVPISALSMRPAKSYLVLDLSEEQFKGAPAFSAKRSWPTHADKTYWGPLGLTRPSPMSADEQRRSVAGERPPGAAVPRDYRLSQAIDIDVKSGFGQELGEIEDLYIELRHGRIAYGLIEFDDVVGLDDKMAVVPWSKIDVNANQQVAILDATAQRLQAVVFPEDRFPQLDATYLSRISRHFDTAPYWEVFGYPPPQPSAIEQRHGD